MKRKLPPEAFDFYIGLGLARSYQAVAQHFGVSKAAVTNRATREKWQERHAELEAKARRASNEKAVESMEAIYDRHLLIARTIQGKALEALAHMPLSDAMDAVRALDLGVRQERLLIGEPTDRNALSVEEMIKREYALVMRPAGEEDWPDPAKQNGVPDGTAA